MCLKILPDFIFVHVLKATIFIAVNQVELTSLLDSIHPP